MTAPRDPIEAPATERLRRRMEVLSGFPSDQSLITDALAAARDEGRREAVRLIEALEQAATTFDDIAEMMETGGDIPTEATIGANQARAALARHGRSSDPEPAPLPDHLPILCCRAHGLAEAAQGAAPPPHHPNFPGKQHVLPKPTQPRPKPAPPPPGAAPRAEGQRLDWIEITEEHEFGVEAMTEPRTAAGRRLLGEGLDRTTVAKVLHAMREGRGGLVSCYHGADGSECSYHAALFLATLARLSRPSDEREGDSDDR